MRYPKRRGVRVLPAQPARTDVATPFGVALRLTACDDALVGGDFVRVRGAPARGTTRHPVLREAEAQVRAYFARRLDRFDVPLRLDGTPFATDVWRTVAALRFGDVVSYADIARAVGRPLAHRGVAAAMRRTPVDLFIAAHRVVGADGKVRGCGPRSLRARLLAFERARPSPSQSPSP